MSFFIANIVMSGFPAGLVPRLSQPYVYAGDELLSLTFIQRSLEGWIFDNPRMGWPFGSAMFDYPGSEAGNYLVFKALGLISHTNGGVANLYFLLGFSAAFISAFVVLCALSVRTTYASASAFLFAFAPFHFSRLLYGHLLYTCYFTVPLFFYYGIRVYYAADTPFMLFNRRSIGTLLTALVVLSSFGVYFAFFGVILLGVFTVAGIVRSSSWKPLIAGISICGCIGLGVIANLMPTAVYRAQYGVNSEVAARVPQETEVYSLKIIHLLLPQPDHRIPQLANFTKRYNATFPLSNTTSALGVFGIIGFICVLGAWMRAVSGREVDAAIGVISLAVVSLILVATVGGFNVVFATLVSPLIRGWDRISIFINFGALAALAISLSRWRWLNQVKSTRLHAALATCMAAIGFLDQTPGSYWTTTKDAAARWQIDAAFVGKLEATMPTGAAIYQLPYFPFPESGPQNALGAYQLASGFLNSHALKWSYGGMQGRPGDLFFRSLSTQSAEAQLEALRRRGFQGIYIDRRGYPDHGAAIIDEFTKAIGHGPSLERADNSVAFFRLVPVP
ncbi:hypothetical protein [Cupriavidus sp. AcVe19-1a]|uniref:hypothetical protein n=1 Tax=Cupriavidus sp. AcVe19-1a TaxID=2821359 RepID=UPI001AEA4D5E|nr:hypothetical protein [Cupriavidus sp. AcVe19-1a]MBP0628119.1 hypothetical protein [Cupriavidus sp. AcVe19-1a]